MNMGLRFGQVLLFLLFVSALIVNVTAVSEEVSVQRVITAPLRNARTNIIDGSGKEYGIDSVSMDGKGEWTGDNTRVSVSTVALFTLAMAASSGLGAVPFFFVELDPQWSGVCNGMAAGVMLAASFDLIQEGQDHGSGGWVVFGILAGGIFILLCKKVKVLFPAFMLSSFHPSISFISFLLLNNIKWFH